MPEPVSRNTSILITRILDIIYDAGIDDFNCTGRQTEGDSDLCLEYYTIGSERATAKKIIDEVRNWCPV